jgi:hypothetical protein
VTPNQTDLTLKENQTDAIQYTVTNESGVALGIISTSLELPSFVSGSKLDKIIDDSIDVDTCLKAKPGPGPSPLPSGTSCYIIESFTSVKTLTGDIDYGLWTSTTEVKYTANGVDNFSADGSVDVRVTDVPEPASLALLGMGIAGLAGIRRRKATV